MPDPITVRLLELYLIHRAGAELQPYRGAHAGRRLLPGSVH